MLTIVGLGPGSKDYLSQAAYQALLGADKVFVRTRMHPVLDELDIEFESFDAAYDAAEDFESLYRDIAQTVHAAAEKQAVVYAVPGSPYQAESSVKHLLAMGEAEVIAGVSFLEPVIQSLAIDVTEGLMIVDGLSDFRIEPDISALLVQVYSRAVASEVKLKLMQTLEPERPVVIIQSAGIVAQEQKTELPLYQLDHFEGFDHLTTLYVPAGKPRQRSLEELVAVTARLRAPGGCAWDSQQTHESLKRYLIEEAYEVLEAIDREDFDMLEDELGDLLFQAVFHAQIAAEAGYFDIYDVIEGITAKLIRRHSHVFQDDVAATPEAVEELWEQNKQTEQSQSERLQAIPRNSALHYALKVFKLLKPELKQRYRQASDEAILEHLVELVAEAAQRDLALELLLSEQASQLAQAQADDL